MTVAPRSAKSIASRRPMPADAPVTTAMRPSYRFGVLVVRFRPRMLRLQVSLASSKFLRQKHNAEDDEGARLVNRRVPWNWPNRGGKAAIDGVIFLSDHGCRYTADSLRDTCTQLGVVQSMGTVGDSYDCDDAGAGLRSARPLP